MSGPIPGHRAAPTQARTARVTIYQGDDLARLDELDDAVAQAEVALRVAEKRVRDAKENGAPRLLTELPPGVEERDAAKALLEEKVAERDQFADEAEKRGQVIALRSVPRRRWRKLMDDHPPRRDEAGKFVPGDEFGGGVNMSTLPEALLQPWMPRSMPGADQHGGAIVVGECEGIEGDLLEFLEDLTDVDYYDRLFIAAWNLNRGGVSADPTLRLGSLLSRTSDETSN